MMNETIATDNLNIKPNNNEPLAIESIVSKAYDDISSKEENEAKEEILDAPNKDVEDVKDVKDDALNEQIDYYKNEQIEYPVGVQESLAKYETLNNVIAPYSEFIQSMQIEPQQAINSLLGHAYTLSHGSPQQKIDLLLNIASTHGIDINALPEYQQKQQQLQNDPNYQQMQYIQQQQMQQQQILQKQQEYINNQNLSKQQEYYQSQEKQLTNEINDFAKDKPYFNELVNDIQELVSLKSYQNLTTAEKLTKAYNIAINSNEQVKNKMEQEKQAQINKIKEKTFKAKQAASSIVSNNGNGVNTVMHKSIEDAVASAYDRHFN